MMRHFQAIFNNDDLLNRLIIITINITIMIMITVMIMIINLRFNQLIRLTLLKTLN